MGSLSCQKISIPSTSFGPSLRPPPMSRISPVKRVIEARSVRGMRDRMGIDAIKHNHVCSIGQIIANLYGFQPVRAAPV